LSPVLCIFRAANEVPPDEFVDELAGCRPRKPNMVGNCRHRAGRANKFEHGQLRGVETRRVEQGQGASGIVAMHFGQETANKPSKFTPGAFRSSGSSICRQ